MHDVKVTFCMQDIYIINIINHRLHVDNNKDDLSIGYDMVISRDLMV